MKQHLWINALLLGLLLGGCSKLNMENYNKIETGMTFDEVKAILGDPASCSEALGIKHCQWGDEKRSVQISFIANKVAVTAAENLP